MLIIDNDRSERGSNVLTISIFKCRKLIGTGMSSSIGMWAIAGMEECIPCCRVSSDQC